MDKQRFSGAFDSQPVRIGLHGLRFGHRFIKIYTIFMIVYSVQFGFPGSTANNNSQQLSDPQTSGPQTAFTVSADGQ